MYKLKIITEILDIVRGKNATDIHLTAGAIPAVRIDGRLTYIEQFRPIKPEDIQNIIQEMLDDEHKRELKLKHYIYATVVLEGIGRIRANVFRQRGSYAVNIKILDKVLKSPKELGIPEAVIDLHKEDSGLILICGTKNSGRMTTATMLVKKISKNRECQIITIEDPIEYLHKHDRAIINQKEVGIDVNSFAEGMHSAMDQDADVIMTSYGGDPEMFAAILSAAENGHLVIATLQTVDTISTIKYILAMFPEERREHIRMVLGNALRAIISQRLIPSRDKKANKLALEVMLGNQAMQNLIVENKTHQIPTLIEASRSLGMMTMQDSIKELYDDGHIDEVWLNL